MQRAVLIAGLMLLALAWLGPLPELARGSFSAHMSMHMVVVAVAAPLLALGVAGGRFDPVRRWPAPFQPIPASLLELVVVWGWHAPGLHHVARGSTLGLFAEQGMFLAAGLLLWLAAFGGPRKWSGERAAAGVVGLLLTAMHMTLLGVLLALASRPLYHAGAGMAGGSMPFIGELSPLDDQHLGGAIMLLVGGVSYLAGGLYLTSRILRRSSSDASVSRQGPPLEISEAGQQHQRVSESMRARQGTGGPG